MQDVYMPNTSELPTLSFVFYATEESGRCNVVDHQVQNQPYLSLRRTIFLRGYRYIRAITPPIIDKPPSWLVMWSQSRKSNARARKRYQISDYPFVSISTEKIPESLHITLHYHPNPSIPSPPNHHVRLPIHRRRLQAPPTPNCRRPRHPPLLHPTPHKLLRPAHHHFLRQYFHFRLLRGRLPRRHALRAMSADDAVAGREHRVDGGVFVVRGEVGGVRWVD
ncbi:hypothetical protein P152DRAFT_187638 [Eremomyces bilateralis CBS 781.70]|uniref:Uncharacterized protein n=1 Tax=Eremomyces bilateralis CBS 781.70 TaxID=1392243 RepID=A0A6G1GBQ2_9PEZI|nr:uncharacterized protein P152DRAFT_187638 [Eremomyces bilateralis CBS 781.70]KAF1815515.1 hypothetical protein P152DRAFT_187638 [Eremomyces bilateralis CBS 781.70]